MNAKRAISSVLFLIVYLLGFSHSLLALSHQHSNGNEPGVQMVGSSHHHIHHHHKKHEIVEHTHVEHKGHLDDGIFDFIICILTESEFSNSDITSCYYLPVKSSLESLNNFGAAKLVTSTFNNYKIIGNEDIGILNNTNLFFSTISFVDVSDPNRGPPSFS